MTTISPDASRGRTKFIPLFSSTEAGGNCSSTGNSINEQVPVNVGFSLYVYTRHIDDTLQIVEQIIPYFNPDHVIELDLNDAQSNVRIPIVMTSSNISERFDGDFGSRRVNISSLSFIAKSYVYGKVIPSVSAITTTGLSFGVEYDE